MLSVVGGEHSDVIYSFSLKTKKCIGKTNTGYSDYFMNGFIGCNKGAMIIG